MGGTFDPVHHGHLVAASEVQSLFGLDEVAFVPSGQPWQKAGTAVSPAEHRYLMTVIATASNPGFWVSRVDIDRPGPTYTIDTLHDLAAQHPDSELYFITGADADPVLEERRRAVQAGALRRCHPSGVRVVRRAPPAGRREPGGGARDGHFVQRLPAAGAGRAPGLVSGARWRRAVHR